MPTDYAGNSLSRAKKIRLTSQVGTYKDWVGSSDTTDYYKFDLTTRSSFDLSLTGLTANANIELLNSKGKVILRSAKSGKSAESIATTLEIGTYYIRTYRQSGNTNYKLNLSAITDSAGNTLSKSRNLGNLIGTGTYNDYIGKSDPNDYYRFNLSNPASVNVLLNGLSANANVQLIYDANRNGIIDTGEILRTSANTGRTSETINLSNLAAGTYYVRVYPSGSINTKYNLNLSVNPAPIVATNSGLTLNEGTQSTITNSLLQTTDLNNTATQLTYTLNSIPTNGILFRNGIALSLGQTFTQADLNNGLITYQHNDSETTSDRFNFRVSDGVHTLNRTFNIRVNPINDVPIVVTNTGLTLDEGTSTTLTNNLLQITDAETTAADLIYTLDSLPTNGILFRNGIALSIGQTFTQADLNNGLIAYQHNDSETTNDSFDFRVSDGVHTLNRTFNITINPVNDAPTISLSNNHVSYINNTEAVIINSSATVSDIDSTNLENGTLTVQFTANGSSGDRLHIRNQGIEAGLIGVSGNTVTYSGEIIGTFSGGNDGFTPLIITFNNNATTTAVQALMQTITYDNISATASTAKRTVRFVLTDGDGGTSNAIAKTIYQSHFNYGEALQKSILFYEAQRSGDLPDTNRVTWRGDSGLNDGADVGVDLTGGYYDAGDHVKFGFPMASSMTLLGWGAIEYYDAYAQSGQLPYILDAVKWGTDYILKAHTAPNEFWGQVGDGNTDHDFWGAPELMKMERPAFKIDADNPGSDLAGEAAASLAAASILFKSTDADYSDLLLQHAIQLFNFADTYRGKYSDSIIDAAEFYNSSSGYYDELMWGAAWLYKATGNTSYLNKAETYYQEQFGGLGFGTQNWDDKTYGAAVLLAQETGKAEYRNDVEDWLNYWTIGNKNGDRVTYTPGGLAWLNEWGSLRYSANTAFLAFVYSDTVNDVNNRYSDFGTQQISYILGENPNQRSYMVGFGNNSPQNPHHRGAHGIWNGDISTLGNNRHTLYGALVGGPTAPDDNAYTDSRMDYFANEVTLDYNAAFTGALARMYRDYGGQPLSNLPTSDVPDREFFVEAAVSDASDRYTVIHAKINNQSAWPARSSSDLSFRYFIDLTEVYKAGYSTKDVYVQSDYTPGGTVGGLTPWDPKKHIYYVKVDFTGTELVPGNSTSYWEESKIRLGIRDYVPTSAWNPANDWSYQNIGVGSNLDITSHIPVYEFGTNLLFGQLPV